MAVDNALSWAKEHGIRIAILKGFQHPMTVTQLSRRIRLPFRPVLWQVHNLVRKRLLLTLNTRAVQNKTYWLSHIGADAQKRLLSAEKGDTAPNHRPGSEWDLYSWVSYRHRGAIIGVLHEPLRPSQVKRRLRQNRPDIRISADNIRDCLQVLLQKGIVRATSHVGERYLFYQLTNVGRTLQRRLRSVRFELPNRSLRRSFRRKHA